VDKETNYLSDIKFEEHAILIVDDNPTNLGVISDYLKDYGFRILTARTGKTALKRVKYAPPDIILLDVMMPGMDGFATCQRLKADEKTSDIPVIFMTALAGEEDKVKGFRVGAVDYVTKPLHHDEVLARITTHLRIQNLTRKLQEKNTRLHEISTELEKTNEALLKKAEEAKEKAQELIRINASKDKIFSVVAHKLQGPFQSLLSLSETLAEKPDGLNVDDIRDIGENINNSVKNIYNLLDNMLQ